MKPVMIAVCLLLAGCAQLPACEQFGARLIGYEGRVFALIDQENLIKMQLMFAGLNDGTCRLVK